MLTSPQKEEVQTVVRNGACRPHLAGPRRLEPTGLSLSADLFSTARAHHMSACNGRRTTNVAVFFPISAQAAAI